MSSSPRASKCDHLLLNLPELVFQYKMLGMAVMKTQKVVEGRTRFDPVTVNFRSAKDSLIGRCLPHLNHFDY